MFLPDDLALPPLLLDTVADIAALRGELGFDHTLVAAAVAAGRPPTIYQTLAGDFSAASVDAAVRSDPVWSAALEDREHSGVAYYAWGEDMEADPSRVTPARRLGRGGRLALDEGYLYWAPWTAGIEGMIDAAAGIAPSLAERPALRQAAEVLQREGVYSALLTDVPLVAGPGMSGALAPYLVLGLGGGLDADGPFWVVVAVHSDAAAAEASAGGFREAVAEAPMFGTDLLWARRVEAVEATAEGEVMVAVLRSSGPVGDWLQAYYRRDPLLAVARD